MTPVMMAMIVMPAVRMRRSMMPGVMIRMMTIGVMILDHATAEHQAQDNQGDV